MADDVYDAVKAADGIGDALDAAKDASKLDLDNRFFANWPIKSQSTPATQSAGGRIGSKEKAALA